MSPGTTSLLSVPVFEELPSVRLPPMRAARSRIPCSPKCASFPPSAIAGSIRVPLSLTRTEQVVRKVVEAASERETRGKGTQHSLTSMTSFIGGGGPHFWFSIAPEATQTNYAQVIVQVRDKEATPQLIGPIQQDLNKQVPGPWITVRQLQTNPVETPVEVLISGQADTDPQTEGKDIRSLRDIASQAMDKEGNKDIPILVRLRPQDRARLSQIENLYINSSQENVRVPLLSVATLKDILETARIRRREHFRTLSILCFPAPGVLASEVLAPIEPKLIALKKSLPPGYQSQIGGEKAKQVDGFMNLAVVLLISPVGIYLALLVQFNNAVKPLLVFAAAPPFYIAIAVGTTIADCPPHGPGRALISASGSYLG